jgi:hypothetical protein
MILERFPQNPAGHEKRPSLSLPESTPVDGDMGRMPCAVNEKALWPRAGRSAIYGDSEVFHAGCQ